MRRTVTITLLCIVVLLSGGVVAGAAAASAPATRHGTRPPSWVRREALWQSLSAGDARPSVCWWSLTSGARASQLAGTATSWLRTFPGSGRVYVVVLAGHFSTTPGQAATADRLYFIVRASSHAYLAQGLSSARHLDLRAVARPHRTTLRLPFAGPWPLAHTKVLIWQGSDTPAGDAPLMHAHSDWAGFFHLQLAPGAYTLRLDLGNGGPVSLTTVTVVAGEPVAAGVYEDVP